MENKNDGGFLIPEVFLVDKPRNSWLASIVRWVGQGIIKFGCWVNSFGYYQEEIHPRKILLEQMKNMRVFK